MRCNNRNETIQMQLQSVSLTVCTSLKVAYDLYAKFICMIHYRRGNAKLWMCQQLSVSTFQYFPKLCKLFSVYKWESLTDYASYMYRLDIKSFEFEMCGEVRSVRLWVCVEICRKERMRQRKPKRIGIYGFLTKPFSISVYLLCRSIDR